MFLISVRAVTSLMVLYAFERVSVSSIHASCIHAPIQTGTHALLVIEYRSALSMNPVDRSPSLKEKALATWNL